MMFYHLFDANRNMWWQEDGLWDEERATAKDFTAIERQKFEEIFILEDGMEWLEIERES